jgi:hypothetical protein
LHSYEVPGVVKGIETGSGMVVAREKGNEELLFNGVLVLQDEN